MASPASNRMSAEEFLEKMFRETVGDRDVESLTYKPRNTSTNENAAAKNGANGGMTAGQAVAGKAPNATTANASTAAGSTSQAPPVQAPITPTSPTSTSGAATMGNGKDFFAELRKQMIALQEKERSGG